MFEEPHPSSQSESSPRRNPLPKKPLGFTPRLLGSFPARANRPISPSIEAWRPAPKGRCPASSSRPDPTWGRLATAAIECGTASVPRGDDDVERDRSVPRRCDIHGNRSPLRPHPLPAGDSW